MFFWIWLLSLGMMAQVSSVLQRVSEYQPSVKNGDWMVVMVNGPTPLFCCPSVDRRSADTLIPAIVNNAAMNTGSQCLFELTSLSCF